MFKSSLMILETARAEKPSAISPSSWGGRGSPEEAGGSLSTPLVSVLLSVIPTGSSVGLRGAGKGEARGRRWITVGRESDVMRVS